VPLVVEGRDWAHGVFLGSIMGSEITAAAISDKIGQVRRDPFAMLPFTGYSLGAYLRHWLEIEAKIDKDKLPSFFHVNWFRRSPEGKFLWPGFGDNIRVLDWAVRRVHGEVEAIDSPLGYLPAPGDINTEGLGKVDMVELLTLNKAEWQAEAESIRAYYDKLGNVPQELYDMLDDMEKRLAE
jgi:phosphoenolpyruvate carboxykinase (GTP)